ncbi:MAG: outer membrane lipoprotein-sorting protein [bacterium]|nr:outer membrane lipoprotein-sorting protein [bacterium]
MKNALGLLVVLLMLGPVPAGAEETLHNEADCLARNLPQPSTIRGLRVSSRDRTGAQRETIVMAYGRRNEAGQRELLLKFIEPEDVKGSSFLMLERDGENEMYFRTEDGAKSKRISGSARSLALLGSDFTYEDLELLVGMKRPEEVKRLEDSEYRHRPVFVIETRSDDSNYDRVITSIDKERCVIVKSEIYETGKGLRKELTLNPSRVVKKGGAWIPQVTLMTDLRDGTSTMILVDSSQQDPVLSDSLFRVQAPVAAGP